MAFKLSLLPVRWADVHDRYARHVCHLDPARHSQPRNATPGPQDVSKLPGDAGLLCWHLAKVSSQLAASKLFPKIRDQYYVDKRAHVTHAQLSECRQNIDMAIPSKH